MVPKSATKVQAAVGLDVILGQAFAIHLGHDQPAVVGRDRDAVGKPQSVGDDSGRAVGRHQNDAADRRLDRAAAANRSRDLRHRPARARRRSCRRSCPSLSPTGRRRAKAGRPRRSSGACGTSSTRRACHPARRRARRACRPRTSRAVRARRRGRDSAVSDPCSRRTRAGPRASAAPRNSARRRATDTSLIFVIMGRLSGYRLGCASHCEIAATASPRSCRDACWLPCARTPCRYRRRQTPCRSAIAVCAIPPPARYPCGPRQRSRGFPRSSGCGR